MKLKLKKKSNVPFPNTELKLKEDNLPVIKHSSISTTVNNTGRLLTVLLLKYNLLVVEYLYIYNTLLYVTYQTYYWT